MKKSYKSYKEQYLEKLEITKTYVNKVEELYDLSEVKDTIKEIEKGIYPSLTTELTYSSVVSHLDGIIKMLKTKYEKYIKAASLSKTIEIFIKSNTENRTNVKIDNKKEIKDSLSSIEDGILEVLLLFKNDNETEAKFTDVRNKLYKEIYELIKLEIRKFNRESLYDKLINYGYKNIIEGQVTKELNAIDLENNNNRAIYLQKLKLDRNGLESSYASVDLVRILSISGKNRDEFLKELKEFEEEVKDANTKLDNDRHNKDLIESEIKEDKINRKNEIKENIKELLKNGSVSLISIAIALGMGYGAFKGAKAIVTEKHYGRIDATYNSLDNKTDIGEKYYSSLSESKLVITEYTPWEKNKNSFKRQVTTYDLSNVGDVGGLGIMGSINLDVEPLGLKGDVKNETKESLMLDDLYEDTYKEVIFSVVDTEDVDIKVSVVGTIFMTILLEILGLLIDVLYWYMINPDKWNIECDTDETRPFKNIIAIKRIIRVTKENKKISKDHLDELKQILKETKEDYEKIKPLMLEAKKRKKLLELDNQFEEKLENINKLLLTIN